MPLASMSSSTLTSQRLEMADSVSPRATVTALEHAPWASTAVGARSAVDNVAGVNRADIDSALAMLQSAAEKAPLLERALRRAECIESSRS